MATGRYGGKMKVMWALLRACIHNPFVKVIIISTGSLYAIKKIVKISCDKCGKVYYDRRENNNACAR